MLSNILVSIVSVFFIYYGAAFYFEWYRGKHVTKYPHHRLPTPERIRNVK
jgi:hypothetical protein